MSFCRRFPAHLLPQVEDALAHLLHGVGEGEWEVRQALSALTGVNYTFCVDRLPPSEHTLLLAVRDAVLSAERTRLLGMTEAQVVEEAHRVAGLAMGQGLGTRYFSELDQEYFDDAAKLAVRAALPLLVAPERARREAVERERDRLRTALGADTGFDCVICTTRIYGAFIGAGDGSGQKFAHPACYYRRKVEKVDAIIDRVLAGDYGTEAQAIARAALGGKE